MNLKKAVELLKRSETCLCYVITSFAADHSYERVLAYEELTLACYSVKSVRDASLITATSQRSYHCHFYFFSPFCFPLNPLLLARQFDTSI